MSDETEGAEPRGGRSETDGDGAEGRNDGTGGAAPGGDDGAEKGGGTFSDGLRQGLGVLSALKEAIEETISDARERGDLSADRARKAVKDALGRAQTAAGEARERFDFPLQRDFDALVARVEAIERTLGLKADEGRPAADDDEPVAGGAA